MCAEPPGRGCKVAQAPAHSSGGSASLVPGAGAPSTRVVDGAGPAAVGLEAFGSAGEWQGDRCPDLV